MSFSSFFLLLFALFPLASAASVLPAHAHDFHSALPDTWFHPPDHPIHALFRRETQTGFDIPTTACVNDFPPLPDPVIPIDPGMMPQQWKDYFSDNCEGNIPNIPQTIVSASGPTYPSGYDPTSSQVCSATYKACRMEGDIWDAPYGYMALGFDDGPWLGSRTLYDFLERENVTATHFFIGGHIQANPDLFLAAFSTLGDDIAVHTYTHPYLTSLSDDIVFAELAYTMQIIYNCTGGRVAKYWRPPYGDSDRRVQGIAKCLNLTTILWNHDSNDWKLTNNQTNQTQVNTNIRNALESSNKTTGLILLEHELTVQSAQAFIDNYPLIGKNGWHTISAAQMNGTPYQDAHETTGPVTSAGIPPCDASSSLSSTSASQSTASSASSSTAGQSTPSGFNNGVSRTTTSAALVLRVVLFASVSAWLF